MRQGIAASPRRAQDDVFPWAHGLSQTMPKYRALARMSLTRDEAIPKSPSPRCDARLQRSRDTFADIEQVWRGATDTPTAKRTKHTDSRQTTLDSFALSMGMRDKRGSPQSPPRGLPQRPPPSSPLTASSAESVPDDASDGLASPARAFFDALGTSPTPH
ncbi:hypothetical protein MVES1_002156 [Malassezia vespertilionis]|nr:uncharacterized protein MVES1_002156 [Malassezia vespertilionis]WFD06802.1 hypothetical protein MVES1_002156 [Malassezia vespertilionis]